MQRPRLLDHFVVRNLLGLAVLMAVNYLSDWYAIDHRTGFLKVSPYLYLLLLYGWIVFHNRILFERFFLKGKKALYAGWLLLLMALGSFNMNFVLHTEFNIAHSLPFLVNFWVYTTTGLGVYIAYRYFRPSVELPKQPIPISVVPVDETGYFTCMVDGARQPIPYRDILYIESLENYLKVITKAKTYVTRLTMKEAEDRLPKPQFIRISRSAIVHVAQVDRREPDAFWIGSKELRIGRVYKRYVADQFTSEGLI